MTTTTAYPLKLAPGLKEKVWGAHHLQPMLGLPTTDAAIGEAWLVHESLRIANGEWAGQTLAEVTAAQPDLVLGSQHLASVIDGVARFPLLAKFLDPAEWLSVQVHPDDAYARAHEGQPYGKCEAWLVLRAEPPAQIIHGLSRRITPNELIDAAKTGAIKTMMDYVTLKEGDVVMNMPGTIHALGAGVVIYEIQQSSDITYRLYDWDRPASAGRALHLQQSADVSDYEPIAQHVTTPVRYASGKDEVSVLAACRYFATTRYDLRHGITEFSPADWSPHLLTVLDGAATLSTRGGEIDIDKRESVVVPAAVDDYTIEPKGAVTFLLSMVPDLQRHIVQPLLTMGIADDQIVQLGGHARRSDLRELV